MHFNLLDTPSPSFTPSATVRRVYGRPRTFEAIAIHWWGDPAQNPAFESVVSHLCDPFVEVSAHYVATGTGRRVARLVDENDVAWATNSANPYSIAIECDPRCRDEDYDVVAELITDIWRRRGRLPLIPHNKFAQTRCPGDWDLARLEQIATKKLQGGDMYEGKTIEQLAKEAKTNREVAEVRAKLLAQVALAAGVNPDKPIGQSEVDQIVANIDAKNKKVAELDELDADGRQLVRQMVLAMKAVNK